MTTKPRCPEPSIDDAARLARMMQLGLEARRFAQVGTPSADGVYRVVDVDSIREGDQPAGTQRPASVWRKISREVRRVIRKLRGRSNVRNAHGADCQLATFEVPQDMPKLMVLRGMLAAYEEQTSDSCRYVATKD